MTSKNKLLFLLVLLLSPVFSILAEPAKASKSDLLMGNWIRTDSNYRIEISQVSSDGKLKALYLNPKSINVSKAEWREMDGELRVYIELRDENYPGSNYKIVYQPEKDRLAGYYFQAVEGTTFEVEFARIK